jgi:hypothetical protein
LTAEWTDVVEGRMDVRFELAVYLQAHGRRADMPSELLRLKTELPDDATGRMRHAGAADASRR